MTNKGHAERSEKLRGIRVGRGRSRRWCRLHRSRRALLGSDTDAEMSVDEVTRAGAPACDYLLTVDMEGDGPVRGYRFANWELGYRPMSISCRHGNAARWRAGGKARSCCGAPLKEQRDDPTPPIAVPPSSLRSRSEAARKQSYSVFAATPPT